MQVSYNWVENTTRQYVEGRLYGVEGINAYNGMPRAFDNMVKTIWNNIQIGREEMSDTYKVMIRGYVNVFFNGIYCGECIANKDLKLIAPF